LLEVVRKITQEYWSNRLLVSL